MKLILAPPGAGKTRSLVEAIETLLEAGGSPFQILATTFSREGARELSERLQGDVPVRTIHSLGLWVVRVARRARGQRVPKVISAERAALLVEQAMRAAEVKFLEPAQVQSELAYVRERGGAPEALHPAVSRVAEQYRRLLAAENAIDFPGILEAARQELADSELQTFLQGTHLFIDEAQDINPITEWPVLAGFSARSATLLVMASPSQQIYGFKGANWEELAARFPPGVETAYLECNYRSTPEIIEASRPLAGADARHMRAARPSIGQPVVVVDCRDAAMEVDAIGRTLAGWQAAGVDWEEMAVLTRVHALQTPIQQMLRGRNIPYQLVGEHPDVFAREAVAALLGYLQLALDPMREDMLETIINYPPAGVGLRTRHRLRGDGQLAWDDLVAALGAPELFPPPVLGRIGRILDYRELAEDVRAARLPLAEQLERLAALSEIPDHLLGEGDFQGARVLEELLRGADEFATLGEYCDYLQAETRRPRGTSGVHLSTLHAAKGREWRAVVLPHWNDGVLPLRKMDPQEEQNLAFVGLTRARDLLAITLSKDGRPSPFLREMAAEVTQWP